MLDGGGAPRESKVSRDTYDREVARLGAIIENHIDDATWLMQRTGLIAKGGDESLMLYRQSGCRIDRLKITAALAARALALTQHGYTAVRDGSFAWAMEMLERHRRVRRASWREKGTWVMMVRNDVHAADHPFVEVRNLAEHLGVEYSAQTTYVLFTKDRNFHYGWTPTARVMSATDWELVPDNE